MINHPNRNKKAKQKQAAADALQAEINSINQEMVVKVQQMRDAPAGVLFSYLKEADLCMTAKPVPPCTVTNNIPPALLAPLVPIIKR